MIPRAFITEWRATAPWSESASIEQDLVISRALVDLFGNEAIAERLAFRGGTALNKLHLHPPARYSEDIDLVQVRAEPIGETLNLIRSVLDPWLGTPRRKLKDGRVCLLYRFNSEELPSVRMRLKVEINSREHFSELGLKRVPFQVASRWFAGRAEITTFALDELLGTKLRALYQRKKGRDLFDLWFGLDLGLVNASTLVRCFHRYLAEAGQRVTRAQFEANLSGKAADPAFRGDILPLLRPSIGWDFDEALAMVTAEVVSLLPGMPWQGSDA